MKNLNFLSNLCGLGRASQSSDVGYDCRSTVVRPSFHRRSTMLKLVSVLVLVLTIGVGDMWADYTITFKTSGTENLINSGSTYASSTETAYVTGTASGVQFGSNSKGGNILLTMTASGQIKASKITLNGYCKPSSNGGNCKCTYTYTDNTSSYTTVTATTTATATDVTLDGTKTLKSIKLESTGSKKKFYITGVTVVAAGASKTLSSIAITTQPTTRAYLVGETFSKTGAVVTATYSDSSTDDVSASVTWTPTTGLVAGSNTITASYTEGGVTRTTTTTVTGYAVTVQKKDETGATIADAGVSASATGRTLSASGGSTNYVFKQWKFGTASGTSIASSSSASTSLTGTPTAAVTVIAEFYKPIPVSWNKNGSLYETTYTGYNQKPVFPDSPSSCDATSNTFYGWATSTWENTIDNLAGKTVYTSASAMPNVTATGTVYNAVFAKASSGGVGEPTEKFSVDVQVANGNLEAPTGYTLEHASEWKNSTHRQDGSNDPAYIKIYHTSTKLFSSLPAAITIKAELYGGTARDMTSDGSSYYPYVFFTDNAGNEIAGSAKAICTSVTTSADEKSVSMTVSDATNAYGIGIRHAKISGFNLRYSSITLEYAEDATTYSKYLTTCCTDPGLAYGTGSVTKTYGNDPFTNPLTNSHSVAVTYALSSVSPAGCVSINASSGQVTINGAGSATVTASFAGNATYCADEASYTLTVNKANISPTLTYSPNSVAVGENSATPSVGGNSGSGTVTYAITSASPAGCATINTSTGVVTGVAVGSVTVTATVAATDNYNGNTATATVTITAASNFPNGRTIFIQAGKSGSAWSDNACVVAWFHSYGGSETAQPTYWLFDVTAEGDDKGKKLFAAVVPSSGDLPYLDINRYASDCTTPWNKNGGVSYSDASGSNTIRSEGSGNDQVYWNLSGVTMELWSSIDSWTAKQADITDQGSGIWTGTISDYTPDATSKDFKIKTNYNGWIGNTGSNSNATLSGMHVGSTYNITATLNVISHALTMSKTFVKGTVHFDLQGHGLAISDLTNVTAGSKISAPGTPSATGYDFGGWYKEPACTNAWNFGSDVVNETMTLYAKWTKQTYTITSTLNNCSSSPAIPSSYEYTGSAASLSYTITPSSGYRLPTDITVTGTTYTWNSSTGALVLTGTITSNVTITISAVQTHTVDWYVGGSAPANKIGDDGQTTVVDHGGKIEDFPATTPDGTPCDKTFVGWTNTTSYTHGTSLLFTDVEGSPTITADASFYAVFATGGDYSWTRVTSVATITGGGTFIIGYEGDYENNPGVLVPMQNANATATTSANGLIRCGDASNEFNNNTITMGSLGNHGGDDYEVIISEGTTSGTIAIQMADGNYIGKPTSGNNAKLFAAKGACTNITPVIGDDDVVRLKFNNDSSLQFNNNSSQYRFARYKNTQQDVVLYKKTGGLSGFTITCADCGTSVTPTYTASPTGGTVSVTKSASPVTSGSTVKTCTAVDLTVTITPASHYTLTGFTATGLTTGTATITPAVGSTLPVSVAQTFTVTVSAGATGTLTLAPTFTAQTPLSITLETHSKGTFTPIGDIYSGESFTFPTVTPSDAECSSFLGWIEGTTWSGDGTETDPTAITGLANYHAAGSSSGTLTTTKTYTAVFGEKDTQETTAYVKVAATPADWSGDYLIVRESIERAFDGSLETLDAANNYIDITIVDGKIAKGSLASNQFTIAKVGDTDNYTIKSASGKYIGRTATTNGLDASTSTEYTNTLAYSSDHVVITSSGGPTLQMNGGTRFRYYASSQQELQLYKLGTAQMITYTYTTNPACTPRYRVTVNSAVGGSPSADKTYEHADEAITLTAHPAAGYSFTGWTITHTEGGAAASVTYSTGSASTETAVFEMPAYDVTVTATYAKKMVSTLEVKDGATVISTTTGPVSGTVNVSTGANKTLDVVITPSDAYDHSWTATVTAGGTYASITNTTAEGFRVNGLAQGDATITVTASNDEANGGTPKVVTFTVHVTDILPEEIILKRDGSSVEISELTMYYDAANTQGQYVKVNVSYSPTPTNKNFTFSSAVTGKVGSHSHSNANGYEVLVANGVTTNPVNCTFTSSADGSVTKVLAVTVLPILTDRFVDYIQGNATQTVSARLSADRYDIITDINTPSLSDASDADPTSADCKTAHYHLIGWLPQATAEALWAAGTPITEATEGLVRAGVQVEATGQTWYAIWGKEAE